MLPIIHYTGSEIIFNNSLIGYIRRDDFNKYISFVPIGNCQSLSR